MSVRSHGVLRGGIQHFFLGSGDIKRAVLLAREHAAISRFSLCHKNKKLNFNCNSTLNLDFIPDAEQMPDPKAQNQNQREN